MATSEIRGGDFLPRKTEESRIEFGLAMLKFAYETSRSLKAFGYEGSKSGLNLG